ncbi:MAG: hypothetical protein PSX36_15135 [bacterium]|nr:hypothetical protein [bacterium]
MHKSLLIFAISLLLISQVSAQGLYYKNPGREIVGQLNDSAKRVVFRSTLKDTILVHQFNYVLKFYPHMLAKNIIVDFKRSSNVVRTRPYFFSIFKTPAQRVYHITFSNSTKSTLDSVVIGNLSFNSQLGLIGSQMGLIDDMSTGGFFNFLSFYFKSHSAKGKNQLHNAAEERTLDVGLGYQLLSYNEECINKLQIDNWMSTIGYANYIKYYRNRPMKPEKVQNFIGDLPVYITHSYR